MSLIESLYDKPHAVTDCVPAIYIHIYGEGKSSPYGELSKEEKKETFLG